MAAIVSIVVSNLSPRSVGCKVQSLKFLADVK